MWAGDDATGQIYYYESADGLTNWTAHASNPITPGASAAFFPTVYTDGTTFYLYGATSSFPGTGIAVFTSIDRVTWIAHGVQIPLGGVGAWDHIGTFQLNIIGQVAGTWYGSYQGYNGTIFQQGAVTSTDLINWTKSAGNPNIPNQSGNMTFLQVGSTYYGWGAFLNPNAALKTTGNNPVGRFSATSPAGPWTPLTYTGVRVPTYYISTNAELNTGPGLPGANANDLRMVSANGNMYLYYTYTTTGGNEQGIYAALASGYTPAQLVATYEGVRNVPFTGLTALNLVSLASDNFTRADANPIGGNWSPRVAGQPAQIISNIVRSSATGVGDDSYWNALVWNADQWSKITINNETTGSFVGSTVRTSTSGAATSYRLALNLGTGAGAQLVTQSQVTGTITSLQTQSFPIAISDTLILVVTGGNVYTYWNDCLIAANPSVSIASGAAGFQISSTVAVANSGISAWSGGNFQDSPPVPSLALSGWINRQHRFVNKRG
jgi:hypothetical protein